MSEEYRRRELLRTGALLGIASVAGCAGAGPSPREDPVGESDAKPFEGDRFDGVLTAAAGSREPISVTPGTYVGTVTYDKSCKPVGSDDFRCDAGIETDSLGEVNFYYEHDMRRKPCLVPPQAVRLTVGTDRTAVRRDRL